MLARLHVSDVAQGLQRGHAREGHRRCLLKGQIGGLAGQVALTRTCVLSERAEPGDAVDLVTRTEPGHTATHSLHDTGEVTASYRHLRVSHTHPHEAYEIGASGHEMPNTGVDTRRPHSHQNLVVTDYRHCDVPEPQRVGRSVGVLHNRLHTDPPSSPLPRVSPNAAGRWRDDALGLRGVRLDRARFGGQSLGG